ncbi:D-ribose pyranase [Clostridium cylindrosporum]|uniref:D-ribose pyranase n=1 Tax=Clostridium cylindrosporum DSM 605 TaxID=1121307 RepID=A0A0J8G6X0_CLOCY|nr:D-ribose pyranase [Clostridium cylindrosporum]KMT23336.1 D-ribose pyranase RbsD [Clostridium cylindrosporum DSM 605]
MKKSGVLNTHISSLIAELGQTDTIAIVDATTSIPDETKKIDLALIKGIPSFMDTLKAVLSDVETNEVIIAMETEEENKEIFDSITAEVEGKKVVKVSNEQLKIMLKKCRGVIRCGEATPYSNIIIKSASIF